MKIFRHAAIALVLSIAVSMMCMPSCFAAPEDEKPPYLNPDLPVDARVADLMARMTIEEKVSLMHNNSSSVPRLGIKQYQYWNEALHGVVWPGRFTVFPSAIAMSSTWDPGLIHQMTIAISDEAWAANNRDALLNGYPPERFLTFWSPTINMARDPRWGRTPETYGEDPYLTGRLAVEFVRGMQGDDPRYIKTVSTPKHFTANNEEYDRFHANVWVSEKTLREYYLPAFRASVVEGGAMSVMGAFNAINGIPCNANRWLLTDVLRDEWGFKGFVVTDCDAARFLFEEHKYARSYEEAATLAVKAGVDVECIALAPEIMVKYILDALKQHMITEDEINLNVARLLKARFLLGMFDPPEMNPYTKIKVEAIGSPEHMALARQIARESIVLLKNDRAGAAPLLPIDPQKIKTITVAGPNANVLQFGDYSGTPVNKPVNPLEGIVARAGNITVNHVEWPALFLVSEFAKVPAGTFRTGAGANAAPGFTAEYFNNADFSGAPVVKRAEANALLDAKELPADVKRDGTASVRWTGVLNPQFTGQYYFYVDSSSSAELVVDGKYSMKFDAAENRKSAPPKAGVAVNIDDDSNTAIRKSSAVLILEKGTTYSFEIRAAITREKPFVKLKWVPVTEKSAEVWQRAIDLLKKSDIVLAFMGTGRDFEHEGVDRTTLDLPQGQTEYVMRLAGLNDRLAVVLVNGSPLSVNWIKDNVPAVVEAWYPGEQGGNAIADVLFGDYNPAGRLTMTFFKSVDDLPPFNDYEIARGRTYMYFDREPLFPFGFGLSYTSFDYSGIKLSSADVPANGTVKISVDVKNTGGTDGDEVVQLYVRDVAPAEKRPLKRLRGFQRVHIKKGETQTVIFTLAMDDIAYWDGGLRKFAVVPGKYEVLVGASSADIRQKATFTVAR